MNGKKSLTYEHEASGRDFEIEVELNFYKENYGSDADGNRGEMRSYCDIDGYTIYETTRTMPAAIFKILKFIGFKVTAWKTVEIETKDLPTEIHSAIYKYVNDYDYFDDNDCCCESEPDPDSKYDEDRDEE
jgi:hypothetical protein